MKSKSNIHLIVATLKISTAVSELEKMGVTRDVLVAAISRTLLFTLEGSGQPLVSEAKALIDEAAADPEVRAAISVVESQKAMAN